MTLNKNLLLIFFSLLNIFLFIFGFILNENSAGGGQYYGDLIHVWKNLNIVINNNFLDVIDSDQYFSNRTPLLYFIHKYLNPLTDNVESFRKSTFVLSCSSSLLCFFCLRIQYPQVEKNYLILLSTIILLSPYFRTSAYWGLEENFGIICTLVSFVFFLKYKKDKNKINLILLSFFSSCCIYFDQKLLVIPIYFFYYIFFNSKTKNNEKLYLAGYYFLFSLPYLFLIYKWKSIFPISHKTFHSLSEKYLYDNILYTFTIISFYLFPFLFFVKNLKQKLIEIIKNKYFIISLFILIILILFINLFYIKPTFNYHSPIDGGGIVKKLLFILPIIESAKQIVFIAACLFSWLIIYFFLDKNNLIIVLFYIIVSIIIYPLYQETFDPIILLLSFFIFNKEKKFKYKSMIFFNFYYLSFLFVTISYYSKILN